jgi:hypothetical protein
MLGSLLTVVSAAIATSTFYAAVRDCGGGLSVFHLNKATIDPATPVSGKNLTLLIDYTVPDNVIVYGGTTRYEVSYNFIPFTPKVEPLCQDVPCPLGPGTYTNSSVSLWPSGISGMIVMKMKWLDLDNALLQCVEISGQVGDPSRLALVVPWIEKKRRRTVSLRKV